MIYFSGCLLIPLLWFFPWWSLGVLGCILGLVDKAARQNSWKFALSAGLVWSALAFIKDGRSHGLISQRMSGLFYLPQPYLIFAVVFVVASVSGYLSYRAGASIKVLIS